MEIACRLSRLAALDWTSVALTGWFITSGEGSWGGDRKEGKGKGGGDGDARKHVESCLR